MLSPLNPLLYFRRNLSRTLPMVGVIVLAVTLVSSIVTIIHSIDLTIFTLYGYNRYLTGLTPRNALSIDPEEIAKIQKLPELGALYPTHSYQVMVATIFGKFPEPLFGLDPAGRQMLMARCGVRLAAGKLPGEGQPEAVISEDVARNLGLKVGDIISRPESEDRYAPVPIRLVGLLRGPVWLGLTSKSFVDLNSPFTWTGALAFARAPRLSDQRRLDNEIDHVVNKGKVRVWRFLGLVKETQQALTNLYLILNIITILVSTMIAGTVGLLINIYFVQRLPEFATLAAIGYSRATLLRRVLGETVLLCILGWLLGGILTTLILWSIKAIVFAPKGLLLNPVDIGAYIYTLPLPITVLIFAFATISVRMSTLDPVSIIERRG